MKHLYFGPSFVFLVTALGRFSQCFFYVLSSVNLGGQHFYSAPPPPSFLRVCILQIYKEVFCKTSPLKLLRKILEKYLRVTAK